MERADRLGIAPLGRIENDPYVENAIVSVKLRDRHAGVGRFDVIEGVERTHAEVGDTLRSQPRDHEGIPGGEGDAHVGRAGDLGDRGRGSPVRESSTSMSSPKTLTTTEAVSLLIDSPMRLPKTRRLRSRCPGRLPASSRIVSWVRGLISSGRWKQLDVEFGSMRSSMDLLR